MGDDTTQWSGNRPKDVAKLSPAERKSLLKSRRSVLALEEEAAAKARAAEMRLAGATFSDIAATLGVTLERAYSLVESNLIELREKTQLDAESIRDIEIARLDFMLSQLWRKIQRGGKDLEFSIDRVLKIMERRASLLGLDAPKRTEMIGALTAVSPEQVAKMSDSDIVARANALLKRVSGSRVS